jgi:hypothetical protein
MVKNRQCHHLRPSAPIRRHRLRALNQETMPEDISPKTERITLLKMEDIRRHGKRTVRDWNILISLVKSHPQQEAWGSSMASCIFDFIVWRSKTIEAGVLGYF